MTDSVLRKVSLFADLPDEDVDAICRASKEIHLEPGEHLFEEGDRGDSAYIIHDGELEVVKQSAGRQMLLAVRKAGDVIGEMALLDASPRTATVRARTAASLVTIHKGQLDQLMATSIAASQAMFRMALERWKGTEAQLKQNDRMIQLGTLTAGVAHELNNPSAAVKRSAEQLAGALVRAGEMQAGLEALALAEEAWRALWGLQDRARAAATSRTAVDAIERSDRETHLEDWLNEHGVEDSWEVAPALVAIGLGQADLEDLRSGVGAQAFAPALRWLAAAYGVHDLVAEISDGASRISEIVKALKTYSYLDQAPVQTVDLHEGLESTLVILRNKVRGITVIREYAEDLPKIQGYGSELNQVWTNLIDNAAFALGGSGEIRLRTRLEGNDWVVVEVEDNGPGIPPEVQPRIFDAFFTTKPPGQGTGLGLEVSYSIVVFKHRGEIKVASVPGRTSFTVSLPVKFQG